MSRSKRVDCAYCDKEQLSNNEIGLNKKLINREIERMMCLSCMAAHFEITEEDLKEMIERLKRQGCVLFG